MRRYSIMKVIALVACLFWLPTSGAWAYTFWNIIRNGSVAYVEPHLPTILIEFTVASLFTICALIGLGYITYTAFRETMRRS